MSQLVLNLQGHGSVRDVLHVEISYMISALRIHGTRQKDLRFARSYVVIF